MKRIQDIYCNGLNSMNRILEINRYYETTNFTEMNQDCQQLLYVIEFANSNVPNPRDQIRKTPGMHVFQLPKIERPINTFDVLIMDSIYTLYRHGYRLFEASAIVELITPKIFDKDLIGELKSVICESIDKMSKLQMIYGVQDEISEGVFALPKSKTRFLPVVKEDCDTSQYRIEDELPLYKEAESLGRIFKIPRKALFLEIPRGVEDIALNAEIIKIVELAKQYPSAIFAIIPYVKQANMEHFARRLDYFCSNRSLFDDYFSIAGNDKTPEIQCLKIKTLCIDILQKLQDLEYIVNYDTVICNSVDLGVVVVLKEDCQNQNLTINTLVDQKYNDHTHQDCEEYDEVDNAIDELLALQISLTSEQTRAIRESLGLDYFDNSLLNALQTKINISFKKISELLKQKKNKIAKSGKIGM